ncbi:GapR family DNA-binding domain-containing protein [Bradyrhizobium murdochi]|uniref:GapR family DNA-binding domain-containing protein n=1 Tax=Bradyrhizobium murdochi TaxID=1038859 RepID=UPI0012EBC812|nr:hypothetical protein [Bradyrhizobium murdochi]
MPLVSREGGLVMRRWSAHRACFFWVIGGASERGSSMARCRNIRESINNVFKEAKARGILTKELRALVKNPEERKQEQGNLRGP